ncbi:hypothetical protein G6F62_015210 [Rhizopus arrhizus]|nr:hypothetical protein G6F62_015210 [Rhizopus arrhizus]
MAAVPEASSSRCVLWFGQPLPNERSALADRLRRALACAAAARRGRLRCRPRAVPPLHAVNAAAAACPYNRPHVYRVDPL